MNKPHASALAIEEVPQRQAPPSYSEPFESRMGSRSYRALGDAFDLTHFGVDHSTLAPGAQSALRHWHAFEDEFIFILAGQPTLVTDAGETLLAAGVCAGFPGWNGRRHHLINRTDTEVVYLEVGERIEHERTHYPDDDLVPVYAVDHSRHFEHHGGRPYPKESST